MPLNFTKMHGLGNDFIVINALEQPLSLTRQQIQRLSHRKFGIGFDQLLVVEPATTSDAEFNYRIFNCDGGEVENCGNGARCFARYVLDKGLATNHEITVSTSAGLMKLTAGDDGLVTVMMERPQFTPSEVPFVAEREADSYQIDIGEQTIEAGVVSVGNPHVVTTVAATVAAPIEHLGPLLESHERFPARVNVGFMQVDSKKEIHLRVYERGVGETMACGTGACAAVVVGIKQGLLDTEVLVHLTGGDLWVNWSDLEAPIMMTGPSETVFEGRLE